MEALSILAITALNIYTRLALIAFFSEIISYGFLHGLSIPTHLTAGIFLNILFWYPFVTLGNTLAAQALKAKNS